MVENKHKERLQKRKDALLKSFDNLIEITEKDINKKENDDSGEEITLKDDKIKTYAEGILKAHQTLESITTMIKNIDTELKEIEEDEEDEIEEESANKETKEDKKSPSLNHNLE